MIVTERISAFQSALGIDTTTMWSPTGRLMLMGVTLPVFTPSTATFAPEGKDVILSEPLPVCACRHALRMQTANNLTAINFNFCMEVLQSFC